MHGDAGSSYHDLSRASHSPYQQVGPHVDEELDASLSPSELFEDPDIVGLQEGGQTLLSLQQLQTLLADQKPTDGETNCPARDV